MKKKELTNILNSLLGLKFYEWKSIENAVNDEFKTESNRRKLKDISKIKKRIENEIIH